MHEGGVGWVVAGSIVFASFDAQSVKSLPGMLECLGTHCMKMDDEMDDMH